MERLSSPQIQEEILQQPGQNLQGQNSVYLSHEDIDNIETDEALKKLLQSISCSFDQNKFSMLYKDKNLEKEFLCSYHQKIIQFGLIYTIEVIAVFAEYFIFQTAKLILLQYKYPAYKWAALTVAIFYLVTISIYVLARRFISDSNFRKSHASSGRWIYRNFCNIGIADPFRYARFNIFLLTTLGIVYIFSRATHFREREKFEQAKKQKQLLKLFHNLIRVYHDGILITKKENIVYSNTALRQIFNIEKEAIQNLQSIPDLQTENLLIPDISSQIVEQLDLRIEEQFIQGFKKTIPKFSQNQMSNTFTDAENQNEKWFTDIWDYIQQHQKHLDPIFFNKEYLINPLDGLYFKFKYSENQDVNQELVKFKILQVFTQTIRLGQQMFVMTTIRDQSNWLEIEKQKNLSQLKTVAFAQAAHEFRNPLNAINSSLQLLDNTLNDIPARQYLVTAKNSSRLMLYLINDILDFSQIESQSLVLNYEDVNICQLIQDCFSILELKAQVKELELSKIIDPIFPKKINTDPNRLQQILINLLSNSIKYTNEGFVRIFAKVDQANNQLNLIIKDSGVGMDKQQLSKLFTAFTKIMQNRDMNKDGVGLGLTISKNLAQALGGDINKTLKIVLNLQVLIQNLKMIRIASMSSQFQDIDYSELPYTYTPTRCHCSRILLVDDEPFNLITLQGLLDQYSIDKVDKCYNGKQAVEKIKENFDKHCLSHQSYELVIIDNQMPVMNGIDACKEIRIMQQNDLMSKLTRIVLLTGDESMLTKDEYINLFDDVILKPIDSNILGILLMQTSSQN
ncbi:sensor kinase [Stylonychia lemnae]|uniref:Sensor kinase n=1 Tax=Stylonychia lemnae TaxID=5949 RepID=A0A078AE40_STYLE|nr:sensor kinase [Stylonychia lemnae]|eukprot:CDW80514.1 sensor kinase [Stylonychia lemnae]